MNIMANATMTLVIEFMSVPNPILDNGPINKTSNPPPTSIRIHICLLYTSDAADD